MSEQNKQQSETVSWKTQVYALGAMGGAILGFVSAYLFAREAEYEADADDGRPDVPPTVLLGLALSILTLIRQIAETPRRGKKDKK